MNGSKVKAAVGLAEGKWERASSPGIKRVAVSGRVDGSAPDRRLTQPRKWPAPIRASVIFLSNCSCPSHPGGGGGRARDSIDGGAMMTVVQWWVEKVEKNLVWRRRRGGVWRREVEMLRTDWAKFLRVKRINIVSTVIPISRVAASISLRHCHGSVSNVHEAWCADEERVRKTLGLLERSVFPLSNAKEWTCGICFDSYPLDRISTAACVHPFCSASWRAYMNPSIDGGPGCLMQRCPADPSCGAVVGQDRGYGAGLQSTTSATVLRCRRQRRQQFRRVSMDDEIEEG
ncbi:RBR-type E3 ubiquitin transferase, partial [Sarracenia purpurea var. burkii]